MSVKTEEQTVQKTSVEDDLQDDLSLEQLKALKDKIAARTGENVPPTIVKKKTRSIKFGVVGTGQAGSRLAEEFHKLGYDCVVFNTAQQDLEHINVPDSNKMLLQYGLGGAAKELEIGKEAAEMHRNEINQLIHEKLEDSHVNVLCLSLGGGSGAGSLDTMVEVLASKGKPIVVLAVLPMESDDATTKSNSLSSLAAISKYCQNKQVQSIVVVDNARIESILSDVNQLQFFNVANQKIVEPIEQFNLLSSQPSPFKALDSTEWAKLLVDGEGFTIFGSLTVSNYEDDTALAEAILNNMSNNLLAEGFDITQSKYAGFIVAGNEKVLSKIPQRSFTYANALVQEKAGTPKAVFRGIYVTEDSGDHLKVYSCFSGLGLPTSRIDVLKKEAQELMNQAKSKDNTRNMTLNLDTGTNETVSAAQKVKEKIAQKSSAFGKFMGSVTDKRK